MKRVWHTPAKILAGVLVTALYSLAQTATVSARPGAINYLEGSAFLDGQPLVQTAPGQLFLNANQTLSTTTGRAEILLTPGVFLRIGNNSEIRMVSPSLIGTQVELNHGEAMIEAAQVLKENNLQILARGGVVRIEKAGLYRVTADAAPTASVLDGKAEVTFAGRTIQLGGSHETLLAQNLKSQRFDKNRPDDLLAWSSVRSAYDAQATYAAARGMYLNGNGYGYGPGWYWYPGSLSWAWWPGAGFAYSPFGWGFYGPGYLRLAPVFYGPIHRTGFYGAHGMASVHGFSAHGRR